MFERINNMTPFFFEDATEIGFEDQFYREGLDILALSELPDFNYSRAGIGTVTSDAGKVSFVAENIPRITDRGLLVEGGGGVNFFSYSEDYTDAAWTKLLANVEPNAIPSPRVQGMMSKIIATGSGVHSIGQTITGVSTVSFYAKAGSLKWVAVEFDIGTAFPIAYFNLETGEIGNVNLLTARIERAGRGAWRIHATIPAANATVRFYPAIGNGGASFVAGSGPYAGGYIYLDMAQAHPAAAPISYIGTQAAGVNLNSFDETNIFFTPQEDFTIYVEAELPEFSGADNILLAVTNASRSERVAIYRNDTGTMALQIGSDVSKLLKVRYIQKSVSFALQCRSPPTKHAFALTVVLYWHLM